MDAISTRLLVRRRILGERPVPLLTTGLLAGLVAVVPGFTLLAARINLPVPSPSLVGVAVVLGAYAVAVVVLRRVVIGTFVALLVLTTFAANVPLTGTAGQLPGALGPNVWLFEPALAVALGIAAVQRWDRDVSLTPTHYALGAFLGWCLLAAVFGAGPRPDVALYFALHVALGFATFALVAAAVQRGVLHLRDVVTVVGMATLAQAAFAVVQLLNQESFGLTYLGEVGRTSGVTVSVLSVRFSTGVYLSGFTGSSAALVSLALLVAPVAFLYAVFERSGLGARALAATISVGLFAVVRLTLKDAGHGGAAVVVLALVAALGLRAWLGPRADGDGSAVGRGSVTAALAFVVSVAVLMIPISAEGGDGGGGSSGGGGGGGIDSVSIDFRVQQYAASLDATASNPLFGLGGANFPYVAARYGLPEARAADITAGHTVHNAYLAVLVGTGVPGFLLYAAALATVLWAGVDLVRRGAEAWWLVVGLLCGFVGYLAYIFWDVLLVTVAGTFPFWALAGGLCGSWALARATTETDAAVDRGRDGATDR